jgi:hypothetical protein
MKRGDLLMDSDLNKECKPEEDKRHSVQKEIKEWARSIILAVILAVIIRLFFLEVFFGGGDIDGPHSATPRAVDCQ